ncbi:hypothetical protein [Pseudoalteromonas sp. T1lg24]|uniref:hypothetical protein n=1 Tax=Pseudoalteromonas sp. T1lg24 TaxID=2077099 RepID=UPI000CF6D22A|nr:hypothetical protein [Pseudoalteromonas sp. T1lg24]
MFNKIIKHPLTGILIGISVSVILYFSAKSEVEPKYATQTPRLLAEVTDKTGDLTLLWKKNKIDNLYSTDVLLWNAGNNYLDKSMFSATDRLRLCPNKNTNIFQARFIKTSRETLQFSLEENGEEGCLFINIIGDEAIESGDGGLINILFSGNQESKFSINGRIKGYKDGFQAAEWSDVVLKSDSSNKFFLPLMLISQLSMGIYVLFTGAKRLVSKKRNTELNYRLATFDYTYVGMGGILIITTIYLAYEKFGALFFGVQWATS